MLYGPMFESADDGIFRSVYGKESAHYNQYGVKERNGMQALRQIFPDGQADDLNFVLFSTSGVHGSYCTIEDVEREGGAVTFLIVQPRICCLRHGNCLPEAPEDFEVLKKLRQTSWEAVQKIGAPE